MQKYYLGIDLGSTTSKAVIINDKDEIIGRGITNTRANYKVAADIAREEAIYDARFTLLSNSFSSEIRKDPRFEAYLSDIRSAFQYLQFSNRMKSLVSELYRNISTFDLEIRGEARDALKSLLDIIEPEIKNDYIHNQLGTKNQFFRDILAERYNAEVQKMDKKFFEPLMLAFDKSITPVENEMVKFNFKELIHKSMDLLEDKYKGLVDQPKKGKGQDWYFAEINEAKDNFGELSSTLRAHIDEVADEDIHITNMVGTGYGRALLPFPEQCIKSEILCHAFGAHAVFPNTRTVLDIGGQDTKAIQVDSYGLVTSFHMNDRCAAGCGRYLGYIADEFNISLNELGPEAMTAEKETTICSTCTVFAGSEVRELLNNGEKRPNILAGLHRAIVQRAMSLIARSGGVRDEFTFTGGVARNQAVLKYVQDMVKDSYGEVTMNVHPDSIFMGALGGAMFARRDIDVELPEGKSVKQTA